MSRLKPPANGPEWLPAYTRSIERELNNAASLYGANFSGRISAVGARFTGLAYDGSIPDEQLELGYSAAAGGYVQAIDRGASGAGTTLIPLTLLAQRLKLSLTDTVAASAATTTHKLPVEINGSVYYLLLSNV